MNNSSTFKPNRRVPLVRLMQTLKRLSRGPHQWAVRPVAGIFVSPLGDIQRFVLVGYSNPHRGGLPNQIVYAFPLVFTKMRPDKERKIIILLSRAVAVPLATGLYLVGDQLSYDKERDWKRFWTPVEALLDSASEDSKRPPDTSGRTPDNQGPMLDGTSYEDAMRTCLAWWGESKEVLQNAL